MGNRKPNANKGPTMDTQAMHSIRCDPETRSSPPHWTPLGLQRDSTLRKTVHQRHEVHQNESNFRRKGSRLTVQELQQIREEMAEQAASSSTSQPGATKSALWSCEDQPGGTRSTATTASTCGPSPAHKDVSPVQECIVCFDSVDSASCGRCADSFAGHVLCRDCLTQHVKVQTDPLTSSETLQRQGRPDGSVKCAADGCSRMWEASAIARLVPSEGFEQACELRLRVREGAIYAKAQAQLSAEITKVNELLRAERSQLRVRASRQLLAEQLRRQMPNARQCGGCGFGPIDHGWCADLRAHHNEARPPSQVAFWPECKLR